MEMNTANSGSIALHLKKRYLLKGTLTLKSGLHIGAGRDAVKIGGVDNPVVRAVMRNNQPYIPGSSLKGKMRSLLELSEGIDCTARGDHNLHPDGSTGACSVCMLFGGTVANDENHASRVVFRDAYLLEKDAEKLAQADTDYPYTEVKAETAIDRITGRAKRGSLRQTERIPAGVRFGIEVIVSVCDGPNELSEEDMRALFARGVQLLNSDYLGGSGSRGYGHVDLQFEAVELVWSDPDESESPHNGEDLWKQALGISWEQAPDE